nr:hypothetical protein [Micromonospora acroterricola]
MLHNLVHLAVGVAGLERFPSSSVTSCELE